MSHLGVVQTTWNYEDSFFKVLGGPTDLPCLLLSPYPPATISPACTPPLTDDPPLPSSLASLLRLVTACYQAGTAQEWRERGLAMFRQELYEDARVCFENAGDTVSADKTRAKVRSLSHAII